MTKVWIKRSLPWLVVIGSLGLWQLTCTVLQIQSFILPDPIDVTAVVEWEMDGTRSLYFIGPKSGGLEIEHWRKEIMVITPQSPLGQNLIGRKAGHRWSARLGGSKVKYHIVSVS